MMTQRRMEASYVAREARFLKGILVLIRASVIKGASRDHSGQNGGVVQGQFLRFGWTVINDEISNWMHPGPMSMESTVFRQISPRAAPPAPDSMNSVMNPAEIV